MTNILLLGDTHSGKSMWLYRLKGYKFTVTYIATLGKDTALLKYDNRNIVIHDMGGEERFHSVIASYYDIADGAIIFFDASNKGRVDYWKDKLPKGTPYIVYGTKRDLLEDGHLYWNDVLSCKDDMVITAPLDELLESVPTEISESTFLEWVWNVVAYYLGTGSI